MKNILFLSLILLFMGDNTYKIDFGNAKDGADWGVINDGVMGGRSRGEARLERNSLNLAGSLSLANNGGFSSVKSPFQKTDLSKFKEVEIRYKAKGGSFSFTLETAEAFYLPYYKKSFASTANEWETVSFKLTDFNEYVLSRETGNQLSKKNLANIIRIGFIKSDKKEGSFELEVDYVEFRR